MLAITSGKKRICCVSFAAVFVHTQQKIEKRIRKKKQLIAAVLRCDRNKYSIEQLIAAVMLWTAANKCIINLKNKNK